MSGQVRITSGKPNWPLLTLAGLSLIPGFGFLIGAVALTWALISSRSRARLAMILAGAGLTINIGLAVFAYRLVNHDPEFARVREVMTAQQLTRVVDALEEHRAEHGRYPVSLDALVAVPRLGRPLDIYDQSKGFTFPPRPFQYLVLPDSEHYTLIAVGPDGEPWTADDIAPILDDPAHAGTGWLKFSAKHTDLPPPNAP